MIFLQQIKEYNIMNAYQALTDNWFYLHKQQRQRCHHKKQKELELFNSKISAATEGLQNYVDKTN